MHFARESIFKSALRSLFTCCAAVIGILIGVLLVGMVFSMISGQNVYPEKSEITLMPNAQGSRDLLPPSAPVLLRLDITGVIGQMDLTTQKFENLLLDSQEGMLAHGRVKGILLYINSPGGTVDDSAGIYSLIKAYKEKHQMPVYAFVDGLCASGGMYIACSADKIFATSSSIIGSVGVLMGPTFNVSSLMERYGVQSVTLTEGKDKDMLNPFRPWKPGEDKSLRNITSALYSDFVDIVTAARSQLSHDQLVNNLGAQIYVAKEAATLGYIDVASANYSMALQALMEAAQIAPDTPCQVVQLTAPRSFLSDLTNSCQSKITHLFPLGPYMNSDLSGKWLYLYQPPTP